MLEDIHMPDKADHLLATIPPPDELRQRLRENQRERSVLRQLLRIATRAAGQSDDRPTVKQTEAQTA